MDGDSQTARKADAHAVTDRSLSPPPHRPRLRLLLVTALANERHAVGTKLAVKRSPFDRDANKSLAFHQIARHSADVVLAQLGMGPKRAGMMTQAFLDFFDCQRVVMLGLAGGLNPQLSSGAVVWARRVMQVDQPDLVPSLDLSDLNLPAGALVTTENAISSTDEKQALFHQTGADAVDMESYAVARACESAQVPWAVVRVVADPAQQVLPASLTALVNQAGDLNLWRSAAWFLTHPGLWAEVFRINRHVKQAERQLRQLGPLVADRFLTSSAKTPL